jgi:hypothetical protein
VKWHFLPRSQPSGMIDWFDTQGRKHAAHFYLRNRTTAHSEYALVVVLIICWNFEYINSVSLSTHRVKKQKYEISRTFAVIREKTPSVECSPAHRSGWHWAKNDPNESLSMESNCWPQLESFELKLWKFGQFLSIYKLSLREKETHGTIFSKKHVQDTRW